MTYLATNAFNPILSYMARNYRAICSLFTLPERSLEGRLIQGIRIGKAASQAKRAILLYGGCHARELVNPDLLITFAGELLHAYTNNIGVNFGPVSFDNTTVKLLIEAMDIIIVPLVNPDGRAYVQSTDPWWRKNRNPNPGETCMGVDINRNFDLLWSSGIGTSANSCAETHKGKMPFSEPETRNIRWLLDHFPTIEAMIDVHSYSELVLYPWGDDQTQTTDPNMNFANPAFHGQRGIANDAYREYMRPQDLDRFEDIGFRMRDMIFNVRGHCYTVKPSFNLYPTSGTSIDYAYSRHIVDENKRKIWAFTLETGREFQPPAPEVAQIMTEVCAGLFDFCLAICCPVLSGRRRQPTCSVVVGTLNIIKDPAISRTPAGQRYLALLREHFTAVRAAMDDNKTVYSAVVRLVRATDRIAQRHYAQPPQPLDARLIHDLDRSLSSLVKARNLPEETREIMAAVRADLPHFEGRTFADGLKKAGGKQPRRDKSR